MKERGGKLAPASHAYGSEHKDEDGTSYTEKKTANSTWHVRGSNNSLVGFVKSSC